MEQEEDTQVFTVADSLSCAYGNTMSGRFVGNKIAIQAYRPVICSTVDRPTEHVNKYPVVIQLLKPEFIFENPILRSLIAETNSTFVTLQNLKKRGSKFDYLNISRTYRSIIRACLEKLQEATAEGCNEDNGDRPDYEQYITILYSAECIWHLTEILFLDTSSSNVIVPHLLDWNRFHFAEWEPAASELLLMGRNASNSSNYWPVLKGLILQGQVDVTRALLHLHPMAETAPFHLAEQILSTLPIFAEFGGLSVDKFRSQWEFWLTDTESKLATNVLSIEPKLEELLKIVTGDSHTWDEEIKKTEYWYEYFPGYLFYMNPVCKYFQLGNNANIWIQRWARLKGMRDLNLSLLDRVILKLIDDDMHEVIHSIQDMADNHWLVTHLVDLLYNSGQLKILAQNQMTDYAKLRDSMLFDFGSGLMMRDSMWQLGMDYLEHCSEEGRAALELLLSKVPIRTEKKALKIIGIAERKGFSEVEQSICKIMAKKSLAVGRYGNALEWAIRSKQNLYIEPIADYLLKHYSKTGEMLCPDVIANIGARMFISPRLMFLVKYFDFYQYYRQRDFLPGAELLVNLLQSKIVPKYFWPSLLIDSIPLLESRDPKILTKETEDIAYYLQEEFMPLIEDNKSVLMKLSSDNVEILKDYRVDNIEEIINLLRLACLRNRTRAMIIERTEID